VGFRKLGIALVLVAPVAAASPVEIRGEGTCPSAAMLSSTLETLLPENNAPVVVEVADDGAHYEITVGSKTKAFADPARRCEERARVGAVFVFLAVAPPAVDVLSAFEEKKETPAPPVVVVAEPQHVAPPAEKPQVWHVDVETTPLLFEAGFASGAQNVAVDGGLEGRVVVSAKWLGVSLGVGGMYTTATLDFGSAGSARVSRVPIDVSLRPLWRRGPVELAAELGLRGVVTTLDGIDMPQAEHSVRGDVGVRVAALGRFWLAPRAGVFFSAFATGSLAPIELRVDPYGRVGSTPALWTGASLGLFVRMT
jgi:hypothetical protein